MALIHLLSSTAFQNRYVNDSDSNSVTNSTSETVLDQYYTLPPDNVQTLSVGTTIRITAMGTISTGLLNLGFRFRLRVGGLGGNLLCDTGGLTILSSLTNAGWLAQSIITLKDTGPSGLVQAQNYATMQSGTLLAMPSTSSVGIDTTQSNDFTYTAQWTTASSNNVFIMRSIFIEALVAPT